tara:strand:- start:97 stop:219 length:123 start_codon:yes stop_codon:yes gene_type:complete
MLSLLVVVAVATAVTWTVALVAAVVVDLRQDQHQWVVLCH